MDGHAAAQFARTDGLGGTVLTRARPPGMLSRAGADPLARSLPPGRTTRQRSVQPRKEMLIMPAGSDTHTIGSYLCAVGRWVADDGRTEDSGAAQQLFCFAHAGGGPSFFRPWRAALGPETAVRPVLLPGREWRLDEPSFRHIAELVEPLCEALDPY